MKLSKETVMILKIDFKEGVAKSGKPYAFYVAKVVDADSNTFDATISDDFSKKNPTLMTLRRKEVVADFEIKPKGFDAAISLLSWK